MRRRFWALLCALCLILPAALLVSGLKGAREPIAAKAAESVYSTAPDAAVTTPAAAAYPDVAGDEWFAPAVAEMTQKGIMTGVEGGGFAPYLPVTRATVIVVLWRLAGSPAAEVAEPFPDTEPWFETAAAWAKGSGVATGYNTGLFAGRDPVTREQLACFIYRYAQIRGEPLASGALGLYQDVDSIHDWALPAVRHMVGAGLLQGGDGDLIDPQGIANRAALAVILSRMLTPAMG